MRRDDEEDKDWEKRDENGNAAGVPGEEEKEGENKVAKEPDNEKQLTTLPEENNDNATAQPQSKVDGEEQQQLSKNETNNPNNTNNNSNREDVNYHDYNSGYCLNYIRTFFNSHLDDQWFRTRYSPLERKRSALEERVRASSEATAMIHEATSSLEDYKKKGLRAKQDTCNFVVRSRLGVGTKPTATSMSMMEQRGRKRKYSEDRGVFVSADGGTLSDYDVQTHLHSFVLADSLIRIMDVPSYVTDGQIMTSIVEHCGAGDRSGPIGVYSATVGHVEGSSSGSGGYCNSHTRNVFITFESVAAKEELLDNLCKANLEANRHSSRDDSGSGGGSSNMPTSASAKRKAMPKVLDLDVDCTDAYGRVDIDHDGRGAAPPVSSDDGVEGGDGAGVDGEKSTPAAPTLPSRRCTVFVSTQPLSSSQPVVVLSAAVSSNARIGRDGKAAIKIARSLDTKKNIPKGSKLDDLMKLIFPDLEEFGGAAAEKGDDGKEKKTKPEDVLDVAIAYLRRVHLFSFYNGCTAASCAGDVLGGHHPAGTIHLRLKGADEILNRAKEENDDIYGDLPKIGGVNESKEDEDGEDGAGGDEAAKSSTKTETKSSDLLAMRLDESVERALEQAALNDASDAMVVDTPILIDEKTDELAKEIETAEVNTQAEWIENHSIVDADGRARCSFHFCRKLFKDRAFLRKHLMKKHPEFLRGEIAKCHDSYMMNAWDGEGKRPVPQVLIDCGAKFGLVPSSCIGADRPMAADPEPELWRKEEERMKRIEEEERKYHEKRAAAAAAAAAANYDQDGMDEGMEGNMDGPQSGQKRAGNFVDVDDMKDEKVKLAFDDIAPVAPPKKKKKKKKKLL